MVEVWRLFPAAELVMSSESSIRTPFQEAVALYLQGEVVWFLMSLLRHDMQNSCVLLYRLIMQRCFTAHQLSVSSEWSPKHLLPGRAARQHLFCLFIWLYLRVCHSDAEEDLLLVSCHKFSFAGLWTFLLLKECMSHVVLLQLTQELGSVTYTCLIKSV